MTTAVKKVSQEDVERARSVDLLSYLKACEPSNLKKISSGYYCTVDHDSLSISNGKWYWFSRGIGGASALDYLVKVRGMKFIDAVQAVLGNQITFSPSISEQKEQESSVKLLSLPRKNETNSTAISYLCDKRKLDKEIVKHCISDGLIFENRHHSVVFVGKDNENTPKFAEVRATDDSGFHQNCSGSKKRYSFRVCAKNPSADVHVFEAPIDALSYATLVKQRGGNWQKLNLLSLGGVSKNVQKVPAALNEWLISHPTRRIFLHLDNDEVGKGAASGIRKILEDRYEVVDRPVPRGKDVNDYLCILCDEKQKKEEEFENEL